MGIRSWTLSLVVALFFILAESRGQDRPQDRPQRQPGDRPGRGPLAELIQRIPLIATLDVNGDGEFSGEEIQNAAAALKKLDTNGDGKLSRDEWLPRLPVEVPGGIRGALGLDGLNPAQLADRLFNSADRNGDGKLTREEMPERLIALLRGRGAELFESADANKDGALDREELQNFLRRIPRPGARGGQDRPADRPGADRPRPDGPTDRRPDGNDR